MVKNHARLEEIEDDGYQASTEELFNYLKSVYDDLEERKNK